MATKTRLLAPYALLFLLISGVTIGCGPKDASEAESSDALVIGMELAYPPFETREPNGDPAGVSVDLARALGEALDRPVRIENM